MDKINYYRDESLPVFEIKSCRRNSHPEKKHAHDEYSIALIEKGSSSLEYGNEVVEISEGQVVLIEADIMHFCQPKDINNWSYEMLYVKKVWFDSVSRAKYIPHRLIVKSPEADGFQEIKAAFLKLKSNINTLQKEEILIEIIEYIFSIENTFISSTKLISNNDMACELIKQFIDNNFLEKIHLEQLSKLSGLSQYYIIKLFKQKYDITPHAYQISCRMNYAKREIIKGRDISEIAQEIGFYDQSHFSKTFKAYFGVTPQFYCK
jgi:AraC-like DNA-binding protein